MYSKPFAAQLVAVIDLHASLESRARFDDLSDLDESDLQALVMRSISAITRIAGTSSTYATEARRIIEQWPVLHVHLPRIVGVVKALHQDLTSEFLQTLTELAHAEVFADFLEMAGYLNAAGYKDAAAVLAGSTLESHLRALAVSFGIATHSGVTPIKADKLNADLAKTSAYGVLDQKSIVAHLDLRNKAAHGRYEEYTKEQVDAMISGVRHFLTRTPA